MALATLRGLTFRHAAAADDALVDVSLTIDEGLLVLAGASGSGKSTLLRVLDGLVPHFHGGTIGGCATVAGLDVLRTPTRVLARHAGLVFQDPETQMVGGAVEREVAFGLENLGVDPAEIRRRTGEALELCGIAGLRGRAVATLSGGERQRVAIAATVAMGCRIVALDEPTAQLDAEGAAAVSTLARALADRGAAVVVAEHRLERLLPAADAVAVCDAGRVHGPGVPRALAPRLAAPPPVVALGLRAGWDPLPLTADEVRPLLLRTGAGRGVAGAAVAGAVRGIGAVATRDARAEPAATRDDPGGVRAEPATTAAASLWHNDARLAAKPAWALRGLSAGHDRRTAVLEGVDAAGSAGHVVALVGPNGGGKSTFLRTLAGLLPPLAGEVWRGPGRVTLLPQNPAAVLHLPTVRAEVELTLRRVGEEDDVDALLDLLGLAAVASRHPRDLSSGERQRAAIAALLCGSPALALLDEPTRGMDAAARCALGSLVARLASRGTAVVLATHDTDLAAEVADRILEVRAHAVRDLGPPRVALTAPSPYATQLGELWPRGPATVAEAVALL